MAGNIKVLLRAATRDAYGTYHLVVNQYGKAAVKCGETAVAQLHTREVVVVNHLAKIPGGHLEQSRSAGLALGHIYRSKARTVHPLKRDKMSTGIDNGNAGGNAQLRRPERCALDNVVGVCAGYDRQSSLLQPISTVFLTAW
jgi:hypothetical protein